MPGSTSAGISTFSENVNPSTVNSKNPGNSRRPPSMNPMYQSGWVPADTGEGSYGP